MNPIPNATPQVPASDTTQTKDTVIPTATAEVIIPEPEVKVEDLITSDDENEPDYSALEEEDRELQQKLDEKMKPMKEAQRQNSRLLELSDLLDKPEFKDLAQFKEQLKKIVVDPSFKKLKTDIIIYAAFGKNLQKIGADKERAATRDTQIRNSDGSVQKIQPKVNNGWQGITDPKAMKEWIRSNVKGAKV